MARAMAIRHDTAVTTPTPLHITVNGRRHRVEAEPATPLLYVLRNELRLGGPKFGCGLAQCGVCTVHLGEDAVRACTTPVSAAAGRPVTTLEGLGTAETLHPVQRAFVEEQAAQCGYCIGGMIMSAVALLRKTPRPTDAQIRSALDGNLCRCGTHMRILRAVRRAATTAS
jgi:aerobic-type carbon monoxide dehydrogenase small subunit (CoxS/CutS family)